MTKAMWCLVQKDYSEELKRESAAIKKSADLNTAAANLKVGEYKAVITAAGKVSHDDWTPYGECILLKASKHSGEVPAPLSCNNCTSCKKRSIHRHFCVGSD
jgi:hypothetical protein